VIKSVAREALAVETLAELERELERLAAVLDGSTAIPAAESDDAVAP